MAKAPGAGDVTCPCGKTFTPSRFGRRPMYCSDACRHRGARGRFRNPVVVPLPEGKSPPTTRGRRSKRAEGVEAAVLAELEQVDRVGSSLGQSALFLARSIDDVDGGAVVDSGASRASMVRELGRVMDQATRVAEGAKRDELDGIRDQVAAQRAKHSG